MSLTSNSNGSGDTEPDYESIAVESITSCEHNTETLCLLKANDPRLTSLVVTLNDFCMDEGEGAYHFYAEKASSRGKEICLGWIGHFAGKCARLKRFSLCCTPARRQVGVEDIAEFGEEDIAKLFHGLNHNALIGSLYLEDVELVVVLPQVVEFVKNRDLNEFHISYCDWRGTESEHMQSIIQDCSNLRVLGIGGPYDVERQDLDDYPLDEVAALVCDIAQTLVGLHRLELLSIDAMLVDSGACKALGRFIRTSATLSTLCLSDCYVGNVKEIADAVATNMHLKTLSFHNMGYGVGLYFRRFGDEGAEYFANALACNRTLTGLDICRNGITRAGWNLFNKPLCDTATIADTYYSNHVLQEFVPMKASRLVQQLPEGTRDLLKMNRADYGHSPDDDHHEITYNQGSTSHVAVNKILKFHEHLEMRPFFDLGLVLLPYVIEWFERADTIERDFDARIDQKKLSALYQFVWELPELTVEAFTGKQETAAAGKRKRSY